MEETDSNFEADCWAGLIEKAIAIGEENVSVPMASMTYGLAVSLARRLNISLKEQGTDYVFSKSRTLSK